MSIDNISNTRLDKNYNSDSSKSIKSIDNLSIFPNGIDLYIPMGSYSDPKSYLEGNPCKALFRIDDNSPVMGWYTANYFSGIPEVRNIYITGPKELENEILNWDKKLQDKIEFFEESEPGDTTVAIRDMLRVSKEIGPRLTKYLFFANSDYAEMTHDKAGIIFNDFKKSVYVDINNHGESKEFYFALGNEIDDNRAYARVRHKKIDRKGLILGPAKAVRFGGNWLIRSDLISKKAKQLESIIEHVEARKIKEDKSEAFKYWLPKILLSGENRVMKGISITKATYNWFKKHKHEIKSTKFKFLKYLPTPFSYRNISMEDCNSIISDVLGIKIRFVETLGSADIDNNEELELVRERLSK